MSLILSLFPGLGLLDLAFEQEGYCVVRGPDVLWGGDIRRFHPPSGKFDGVIGGPPCQSFSSLVHLVRANGHEPRFGNLIPEFERCVSESECDWFLMENVPQAPEPVVAGYGIRSFLLDNSMLDGGDGHGLEQRRVRRFSFGMRGREAPLLTRWIDLAVFVLPDAERTCVQVDVNNSDEAKGRTRRGVEGMVGHSPPPGTCGRDSSVKVKQRVPTITAGHGEGDRPSDRKRRMRQGIAAVGHGEPPGVRDARARKASVASSDCGPSVRMSRYRLADALRLQGLPEDFLSDSPFTAEGKLKAVANGVPLWMGRAVARAVKEASQ